MKYLITGGGGNLARQLARLLLADGDQIVLFDIANKPADIECEYVQGDLTDINKVAAVLDQHQPDMLLHMASLLSGKCEQDRELGWQVNVTACFTLFEAVLNSSVKTIFFPSSLAAFGGTLPDPLPEDHAQWPEGIYGVTKATCERLGNYYHKVHGLDFRCLRLPMVISRFAPPGAASAYASRAFVESVESSHFTFKVNPATSCSTVYVQDVIQGIRQFVRTPREKLTRCVYNIHSFAPTAQDLADAVTARHQSTNITFAPDPAIASLIESWPKVVADASARSDWGWAPKYDLNTLADHFMQELEHEFANKL